MSAVISMNQDGKAEMFSGENRVPWHGLGTVVDGLLTSADALKAARLDWQVIERPVFTENSAEPIENYKAIVRGDDQRVLSIMRDRYQIIQNEDCFSFFDAVTQSGEAHYQTAGALHDGKRVWIQAKIPGKFFVGDDEHSKQVLLVSSHDGSYSLMMLIAAVRVVCQNTLSAALNGASNLIKIRHTASYKTKADEARRVLGLAEQYFSDYVEKIEPLIDVPLSAEGMRRFAAKVFPATDETEVPTRTLNIRDAVIGLFSSGAGNRGRSAYDALNAVTDFVDHEATIRGANANRLESALLGSGAETKRRALSILRDPDLNSVLAAVN